jgi:hypothetical protein
MPSECFAAPGAEPLARGASQAATLLVLNLVLAALLVPLVFLLHLTVQAGTAYEHVVVLLCLALGLIVSVNWSAQTQFSPLYSCAHAPKLPTAAVRLHSASNMLVEGAVTEHWFGMPPPA